MDIYRKKIFNLKRQYVKHHKIALKHFLIFSDISSFFLFVIANVQFEDLFNRPSYTLNTLEMRERGTLVLCNLMYQAEEENILLLSINNRVYLAVCPYL